MTDAQRHGLTIEERIDRDLPISGREVEAYLERQRWVACPGCGADLFCPECAGLVICTVTMSREVLAATLGIAEERGHG